jgi:hypothetical protein
VPQYFLLSVRRPVNPYQTLFLNVLLLDCADGIGQDIFFIALQKPLRDLFLSLTAEGIYFFGFLRPAAFLVDHIF